MRALLDLLNNNLRPVYKPQQRCPSAFGVGISALDITLVGEENDRAVGRAWCAGVAQSLNREVVFGEDLAEVFGNDLGRDVFDMNAIVVGDGLRNICGKVTQETNCASVDVSVGVKEARHDRNRAQIDDLDVAKDFEHSAAVSTRPGLGFCQGGVRVFSQVRHYNSRRAHPVRFRGKLGRRRPQVSGHLIMLPWVLKPHSVELCSRWNPGHQVKFSYFVSQPHQDFARADIIVVAPVIISQKEEAGFVLQSLGKRIPTTNQSLVFPQRVRVPLAELPTQSEGFNHHVEQVSRRSANNYVRSFKRFLRFVDFRSLPPSFPGVPPDAVVWVVPLQPHAIDNVVENQFQVGGDFDLVVIGRAAEVTCIGRDVSPNEVLDARLIEAVRADTAPTNYGRVCASFINLNLKLFVESHCIYDMPPELILSFFPTLYTPKISTLLRNGVGVICESPTERIFVACRTRGFTSPKIETGLIQNLKCVKDLTHGE